MIWLVIILSVLTLLLLWILVAPVIIFLNTDQNQYRLSLSGIFMAKVSPVKNFFHFKGRVLFIPFTYNPFHEKPEEKKKKKDEERKLKNISGLLKLAIRALHSFRVRRLELDIDTDDFTMNAWLIPAFSMVNSQNVHMRANFEGHTSLLLDARTRIISLLWIFLTHKIKS